MRTEEGDEYHAHDYGGSATEDVDGVFRRGGGIDAVEYVYENFRQGEDFGDFQYSCGFNYFV